MTRLFINEKTKEVCEATKREEARLKLGIKKRIAPGILSYYVPQYYTDVKIPEHLKEKERSLREELYIREAI